jgi:hypothetical protein
MSRSKIVRILLIPTAAVLIFWLGGYFYFKGSSNWREVQALLSADPAIRAKVGEVKEIALYPLPFMYRFSGDYMKATLRVTVIGTTGEHSATIYVERRGDSLKQVKA